MRYEVLGVVRVVGSGGPFYVSAQKMGAILAALLTKAGHVTTVEQLIREVWGNSAPRRAQASLHVHVSQLRKLLKDPEQSESSIVTLPPGYLLRMDADELDVHDFQRLMDQSRRCLALGDYEAALHRLDSALGLWRGLAFEGLRDGPLVNAHVKWLEEKRLECIEMFVETHLLLGRHREIISQLHTLTTEHPLRETFYRQLMLALYRSERQAEALQTYRVARQRLSDELGLEPCRPLHDIHQAILGGDYEHLHHVTSINALGRVPGQGNRERRGAAGPSSPRRNERSPIDASR